jgi:hypothetical protein
VVTTISSDAKMFPGSDDPAATRADRQTARGAEFNVVPGGGNSKGENQKSESRNQKSEMKRISADQTRSIRRS